MTIQIDLKTRIVRPTDVVYRLFPGHGYRHYQFMKARGVVFLDYPGIPHPEGDGYPHDARMLEEIVRAEERRPFTEANPAAMDANAIGVDADEGIRAVDAKDLGPLHWSQKRNLKLGWLNALYYKAKVGDLVVMPGPGPEKVEGTLTRQRSLIGEITSEPRRLEGREAPPHISRGRFLVRDVRWLAEINEDDLPARELLSLRSPNALITMAVGYFEKPLSGAYRNIVLDGEYLARFNTNNADHKSPESYHFDAFVLAVVAAMEVRDGTRPEEDLPENIYQVAASVGRGSDLVPERQSEIHSPGYVTLRNFTLVPLVISALFALASDPAAQPFTDDGLAPVVVVHSEGDFDPCEVHVDAAVQDTLRILGIERWKQMCEAEALASQGEGLESVAEVEVVPDAEQAADDGNE